MTLFVGIDVSKYKHDLAILDEQGNIIVKNFQFANNYKGFQNLKESLEQLELSTSELYISLEDTGHYTDNLVSFLQNLGYPHLLIIPYLSKNLLNL